jgi:hypothetical protein
VTPFGSPTPVPEPSFAGPSEVGAWHPARYAQDWPGALRSEPAGQPEILDLVRGDEAHWDPSEGRWEGVEHVDPTGDSAPGAPWLDIAEVRVGWGAIGSFRLELAGDMPLPLVSPEEKWMAYGIVLDTNHDGRADVRLGVDNMPSGEHRTWRTDYHTGHTAWKAGAPYGTYDQGPKSGTSNDTWYPGEGETTFDWALFRYFLKADERAARFYAWASLIEDGAVASTDYAPDAGWLRFDDGELPLLGSFWDIESATTTGQWAKIPDTAVIRATFGATGDLVIDACARVHAIATVDAATIRLRDVGIGPGSGCPVDVQLIDQAVRRLVLAPVIDYELERGVLTLRAGETTIRLVGTTEGL